MRKIAIISFSPLYMDARVLRQITALSRRDKVIALAFGPRPALPEDVDFHELEQEAQTTAAAPLQRSARRWAARAARLALRPALRIIRGVCPGLAYEWSYWRKPLHRGAFKRLVEAKPDIIHANDWHTLPLAMKAARKVQARVVADLHEYAPFEFAEDPAFVQREQPQAVFFLKKNLPQVSAAITVSQPFAKRYRTDFGCDFEVVLNAPALAQGIAFRPTDPNVIRIVHHGVLQKGRHPERMIEALALSEPRFRLDFLLIAWDEQYLRDFQQLAERLAPGRISVRTPVPPNRLVESLNAYDLGLCMMPANNYSREYTIPNRFFDAIGAGLAVFVGPSPEMVRLISEYECGFVSNSFEPEDMRKLLNSLTADDIDRKKRGSLRAREFLNADVEMQKLLGLYQRVEEEGAGVRSGPGR